MVLAAGARQVLAATTAIDGRAGLADVRAGAAVIGFGLWRAARGAGNDERKQIMDKLSAFLEAHGDSRFSAVTDEHAVIRDRAGWWRHDDGERVYLLTASGMKEALKGFDLPRALDVLEDAGVLPKADAMGRRSRVERFGGRTHRVYIVRANALEGAQHGT